MMVMNAILDEGSEKREMKINFPRGKEKQYEIYSGVPWENNDDKRKITSI